jgi:predicted protein tyrosine phosphatase
VWTSIVWICSANRLSTHSSRRIFKRLRGLPTSRRAQETRQHARVLPRETR